MKNHILSGFNSWVDGLPSEVLVAAIILGCGIWVLSLFVLVRRRSVNGV